MTDITTFGANLRRARESAGLTQQVLAKRLGFTRTTAVSLWERSKHLPEPRTIVKLAAALSVTPATLMHDVVTPYDQLRGYTVTVPLDDVTQPPSLKNELTRFEQRLIDHLRLLPRVLQLRFATLIEESSLLVADATTAKAPDARYRRPSTRTPDASDAAAAAATRRARRRRKL